MSEEDKLNRSVDDGPSTEENNVIDKAIAITKQSKLNMEVHHHPTVGKKNFKEYFLEFLMIFLAVTLGFFAENIREYFTDKEKEKQYIESFYEDLKTDTSRLNRIIDLETAKIAALNTLQNCYDSLVKNMQPVSLLGIIKNSLSNNPFRMNERTLRQLTNAGGFRLLKKNDADSIISYEIEDTRIEEYQSTLYQQSQDNLRNSFNEVADFISYSGLYSDVANKPLPDATEIKTPLFASANQALLKKYFNVLFQYLRVIVQHRNSLRRLDGRAANLIAYFRKTHSLY